MQNGVYRVVDDAGRVARLEIARSLAAAESARAPACSSEFNVITVGPRRWYFIRLQTPGCKPKVANEPAVPHDISAQTQATGNSHSPCLNRKFDFTGYVSTNAADSDVDSYIPLPEPSDLQGLR
jgi:hypothetical protein